MSMRSSTGLPEQIIMLKKYFECTLEKYFECMMMLKKYFECMLEKYEY
jgi:hypothetical protein